MSASRGLRLDRLSECKMSASDPAVTRDHCWDPCLPRALAKQGRGMGCRGFDSRRLHHFSYWCLRLPEVRPEICYHKPFGEDPDRTMKVSAQDLLRECLALESCSGFSWGAIICLAQSGLRARACPYRGCCASHVATCSASLFGGKTG